MPVVSFNNNTTGGNVAKAAVKKEAYENSSNQGRGTSSRDSDDSLGQYQSPSNQHLRDNDLIQTDQLQKSGTNTFLTSL